MIYRILWGIALIGIIGLSVLETLGYVNAWVFFLLLGLFFIVLAIYVYLKKHFLIGGGVLLAFGIVFMVFPFHHWVWLVFLLSLLVLGGISLFGKRSDPLLACGDYLKDELKMMTFFTASNCFLKSHNFKGGYVHCGFSSVQLDLSQVNMQKDVTIEVGIILGKVELILPSYVALSDEMSCFVGETHVKNPPGKAPTCHLKGCLICGDLTIVFK